MISKQEHIDNKRRQLIEQKVGRPEGCFHFEVEGDELFLSYMGPYFEEVHAISGAELDVRMGGWVLISGRRVSKCLLPSGDLSDEEIAKIKEWAAQAQQHTTAEAKRLEEHDEAETKARIEGARANREQPACDRCTNINDAEEPVGAAAFYNWHAVSWAYGRSHRSSRRKPRPNPHGTYGPFTCACGIQYDYDSHLDYWQRKTEAERHHEHEEMMNALRYGEPDY